MTTTVGMHEAKTHFSQLVERALAGEEIVVTRSGEPVITFVPVWHKHKPNIGFAAGEVFISEDFNETPEDIIEDFER